MSVSKVFIARLVGLAVLGPDGESIGRVRDVVIAIRLSGLPPRVLGLAVELTTRRRIFVPILRVTGVDSHKVTLNTGTISMRKLDLRPGEALAVGQVMDSRVRVTDPDLADWADEDFTVVDLGIEQGRTRDWLVTRVAVRPSRLRLARRGEIHVVDWAHVHGLTQTALNLPGQGVAAIMMQLDGMRPADAANVLRELPPKRREEIAAALDEERLADILQELPSDDAQSLIAVMGTGRARNVLGAMEPDDVADLVGELPPGEAERLLSLMAPEESEPVRRLLVHSPDTAGGMMTPEPLIVTAATTVSEALARARDPEITPAAASIVFVVRPPTQTPTGKYLGCVHLQVLLRNPPATLVGDLLDTDLGHLRPEDSVETVTRYFATYNLVCGPVVDEDGHLLGAVSVDDLLDEILPDDWRETEPEGDEPINVAAGGGR
ncbi:MAG: CBS domain-containing protein [Gordonia sp. (in: high G+C Gram-positive bacteria)]|uniref:magnesium transporter MgtE N-terminal domain-containing protein n=1 Tax=Gordonia sp. (in: high G+C Gram-positive bacteria) TaxID=84139 RepID=UPI0039E3BEC6